MFEEIGNVTNAYTLISKNQYSLLVFEGENGSFITVKNTFDNTSIDIKLLRINDEVKEALKRAFNFVFPDENRINDNLFFIFEKYVYKTVTKYFDA